MGRQTGGPIPSITIDDLVQAGPDPQGAGAGIERFISLGGRVPDNDDGRRLLVALLSNGGFLSDILLADVDAFDTLTRDPYLHDEKPATQFNRELQNASNAVDTFDDLLRVLRRYRRREMLRLGARELGWGGTLEVARELSFLADACVECAVQICDAQLTTAVGKPTATTGASTFVVLAMGKMGGLELNFCSDVDLCYFYATDDGQAGTLSLHEYYVKLSQMVTRAISDTTDDGFVFRVDLRLRPEGRSGAICNSIAAAERYYETFGRTWERQALLRARPCAGDHALGWQLLHILEPFVYPRSINPQAINDVLALRRMYQQTVEKGFFNAKLSPGGIRDVELVAQTLQLLHGGQRPDLRERTTLPAVQKLWLAGLVSDREQRHLGDAYRFLRRLEHRVQLESGAQTQELPDDVPGLTRLARRLGFDGLEDFKAMLNHHRTAVLAIAETLGEPSDSPPALVLRLMDPARSRADLEQDLADAGFTRIEESLAALELARPRMPADWLTEAIASPDPDRALGRFRDLALGGSHGLHSLLRENPQLLRVLANLFGSSDRLSRYLISQPALWETLLFGRTGERPPAEHWRDALPRRLVGLDQEEALREMRRFKTEELLRIGLHDVAGTLEPEEVSDQLATLAETCLRACVLHVAEQLAGRYGLPDAELTVLGMGSVGAREMRYGSDLDLVFLYSQGGTTDAGIDHQEWFARLAQRLINTLGVWLDEGKLYEVDARLRPSGAQGLLVTSYEAFAHYHEDEAALWERAALLRARPLFSANLKTGAVATDFEAWLDAIAYGHPVNADQLATELLQMRARIEAERATAGDDAIHLRLSPGGTTDGEFMAAYAQLRFGAEHIALHTTEPYRALANSVAQGLVPLDPRVLDDYRFLRRVGLRIRLLREDAQERLRPDDRPALARSLNMAEADLTRQVTQAMARIRAGFLSLLGNGDHQDA